MKHKGKLHRIKVCAVDRHQRPGLATAFITPAKLNYQLRDTPTTKLRFSPSGKTLTNKTQWSVGVVPMRPGIAKPVIAAKQADSMAMGPAKQEIKQTLAKGKALGKGVAKRMAAIKAVKQAEAATSKPADPQSVAKAAAKAAGLGRWF